MGQTTKMTLLAGGALGALGLWDHAQAQAPGQARAVIAPRKRPVAPKPKTIEPPPSDSNEKAAGTDDDYDALIDIVLTAGSGVTSAGFSHLLRDVSIGGTYKLGASLDVGLFGRLTILPLEDIIDFESGYTETRTYRVMLWSAGARARLNIFERGYLNLSLGAAKGKSTLTRVATTAPEAPTLTEGYAQPWPFSVSTRLSLSYEWRNGFFGYGLETGYFYDGLASASPINGFTMGIVLRF